MRRFNLAVSIAALAVAALVAFLLVCAPRHP